MAGTRLGRYLKRSVLHGIRRPGAVAGAARFPRDNVDLAVYRTRRLREAGACPPGRLGPGNVLTANYPSHPSLPPQSKFNVFGSTTLIHNIQLVTILLLPNFNLQ